MNELLEKIFKLKSALKDYEVSLFFEKLNINKEELNILYDKYVVSNRAKKRNYGAKKLRD